MSNIDTQLAVEACVNRSTTWCDGDEVIDNLHRLGMRDDVSLPQWKYQGSSSSRPSIFVLDNPIRRIVNKTTRQSTASRLVLHGEESISQEASRYCKARIFAASQSGFIILSSAPICPPSLLCQEQSPDYLPLPMSLYLSLKLAKLATRLGISWHFLNSII